MSKRELIVAGFVHILQRKYDITVPTDVISMIIIFYPFTIQFEGNTMNLTEKEKEVITKWFLDIFELNDKSEILSSTFLYNFNSNADDFHKQCDDHINTFSIIQTNHKHIFGIFVSKPFNENDPKQAGYIGNHIIDDKIFLCVIRSCFEDRGPEIFRVKPERINTAYFNTKSWFPHLGQNELSIYGVDGNVCHHGDTSFNGNLHGNILCGGPKYDAKAIWIYFSIEKMNTFSIDIAVKS